MRLTSVLRRNLIKLLDPDVSQKLEQYAKFTPSPVSIKHFLEHGRKASKETSYFFMRKEIPVRLANIIKELELIPQVLQQQVSFCLIQDLYVQSFQECLEFEVSSNNDAIHGAFKEALKKIRARHIDTVPMMADALLQMKEQAKDDLHPAVESQIQYFLNRLYMSRISIHMMIHQHALTFGNECTKSPDFVGCINPECNIMEIIEDAFNNASFLCDQHYSTSANKNVTVINTTSYGDPDKVIFPYVPSHLHYILFELLKNALRATIETHQDSLLGIPPVDVLVVKSSCDVTIKISDRGGGIPYSNTDKLFQYMYTTAPNPSLNDSLSQTPIAGLGYGLPLSRLYARYFRGDVVLASQDGYGTDVTVYLRALSDEAYEYLPVYNHMTKLLYEKPRPLSCDWTDPTASLGSSRNAKIKFNNASHYNNGSNFKNNNF